MLLKVICQICGKTAIIDTEKPVGNWPRWESYKLEDLISNIGDAWGDYEIWICDECHKKVSEFLGLAYDEIGGRYEDWDIDYKKLEDMLKSSLRLNKGGEDDKGL